MKSHSIADGLMPRTAQHQSESDLRSAALSRTPAAGSAQSVQKRKEAEQAELDRLMAEFTKRGGKVQVLGTTPIKHGKSRRQATTERAQRTLAE